MKEACVTGGAGFLGSHLVEALLDDGFRVTVIDNMMTGNVRNLASAVSRFPGAVEVLPQDVVNLADFRWKKRRFDVIFNFACPASPPAYQADPVHTMLTCVVGTKNVLDMSVMDGATVIQASTSEIYGDPEVHPQVESYKGCVNTLGPRACYDEGKRAAETLCFDYHRTKGVPIKVGRIFNTYGPRMSPTDGRVVSNFIVQALRSEPLTIYGDGTQTRSFCYVDDLINGFMALMKSGGGFTGPVNLGNPTEFTMEELARLVLELTGSQSPIVFRSLPQDDPRQRRPDITLARDTLSWAPAVDIRSGIERTIEYFRNEL